MAVLIIEDLVSRKWLTTVVSVEETSTQVELAFTAALDAEGLLDLLDARHHDGRVDLGVDDQTRPILLAVSDNGPQMTSGSTREFMAMCAIAQHFATPRHTNRPGLDRKPHPTPQGRIPTPARHPRPGHPARRAGNRQGALQRSQAPPGHRVCLPPRRARRTRPSHPQSPPGRARNLPPTPACLAPPAPAGSTHPGARRCWLTERQGASLSQTHVSVSGPLSGFGVSKQASGTPVQKLRYAHSPPSHALGSGVLTVAQPRCRWGHEREILCALRDRSNLVPTTRVFHHPASRPGRAPP